MACWLVNFWKAIEAPSKLPTDKKELEREKAE